jgi:hypothetical protein
LSNTLGPDAVIKPVRTFLPLLTVLFLISYSLLTLLVVEQSRTIDAQRGLIRDLFQDSAQLTSIKAKAIQKQNADAQAKARSQGKTPPAQSSPGTDTHNHSASKLRRPLPQKPPKDTSGESDERRILISI